MVGCISANFDDPSKKDDQARDCAFLFNFFLPRIFSRGSCNVCCKIKVVPEARVCFEKGMEAKSL